MWFKMCPKCGGDLYIRQEIDGKDIICAQCGFMRYAPEDQSDVAIIRSLHKERIAA